MSAEAPPPVTPAERRRLLGLAYRMLGSMADAEDAVQEALVRLSQQTDVDVPPAWLTTVVTRICLDQLRSARHRRETYVGEWLPEPVALDPDPSAVADTADSLTMAFLVVLESLSPLERAAFLLHDVFAHDFGEVAQVLGRSPAAVRQLASRARGHVAERTPRHPADPERARAVAEAFLAACAGEDLDGMLALLAPDVGFTSDGGGLATAVPGPVTGGLRVARMLAAFWQVAARRGHDVELAWVNTEPGLVVREDGTTVSVVVVEVVDDHIIAIRAVRNPQKLARFGPAAPLR